MFPFQPKNATNTQKYICRELKALSNNIFKYNEIQIEKKTLGLVIKQNKFSKKNTSKWFENPPYRWELFSFVRKHLFRKKSRLAFAFCHPNSKPPNHATPLSEWKFATDLKFP